MWKVLTAYIQHLLYASSGYFVDIPDLGRRNKGRKVRYRDSPCLFRQHSKPTMLIATEFHQSRSPETMTSSEYKTARTAKKGALIEPRAAKFHEVADNG